jgi:hypothetical protein
MPVVSVAPAWTSPIYGLRARSRHLNRTPKGFCVRRHVHHRSPVPRRGATRRDDRSREPALIRTPFPSLAPPPAARDRSPPRREGPCRFPDTGSDKVSIRSDTSEPNSLCPQPPARRRSKIFRNRRRRKATLQNRSVGNTVGSYGALPPPPPRDPVARLARSAPRVARPSAPRSAPRS